VSPSPLSARSLTRFICWLFNDNGIAISYGLDVWSLNPGMEKRLISSPKPSRPGLGPIQPPVHWVWGYLPGRHAKFTTHHYLVSRLRMSGAIPLLPLHTWMTWTWTKTFLFKHKLAANFMHLITRYEHYRLRVR
jgi:hypothetical protein